LAKTKHSRTARMDAIDHHGKGEVFFRRVEKVDMLPEEKTDRPVYRVQLFRDGSPTSYFHFSERDAANNAAKAMRHAAPLCAGKCAPAWGGQGAVDVLARMRKRIDDSKYCLRCGPFGLEMSETRAAAPHVRLTNV
jgi:hypothetical protein